MQHALVTVHHYLLELAQTHVHWVGDTIQPPHPLSSPSPLVFNLSQHQVFSDELALCIRRPKYWSFSRSRSNTVEVKLLSFSPFQWNRSSSGNETCREIERVKKEEPSFTKINDSSKNLFLRKGLCTYTHKRNYSSYCGFCPQIHVLKFLPPVSQNVERGSLQRWSS